MFLAKMNSQFNTIIKFFRVVKGLLRVLLYHKKMLRYIYSEAFFLWFDESSYPSSIIFSCHLK